MQITSQTAANLGEKLASLDLEADEAALLRNLIEGEPEVHGFRQTGPGDAGIMFETFRAQAAPVVAKPLSDRFKVELGGAFYDYTFLD